MSDMSELAKIAASVAKALGLIYGPLGGFYFHESKKELLDESGSNLFDPCWQVRCRDWLLENHGYIDFWSAHSSNFKCGERYLSFACPASEFCARAIHALMQDVK